ncbi:uncharacterized protein MELLADRAFT_111097 [Melampsora larici-populina 98AG31]|uniref:Uncharacterized protein n=1 Tax=Melampsora larici-populina (strain 98AG31 / pathotype 3-4-7) TaxID=747676 RepID=F4S212_MELLP|nr:uncharacterized protein MELLADRAFT_111097 [Melampsora larici-populina 98AG31]EGG01283.1 hypothetical protein MELLADRAFT_111097 [Melampsora larici-populina 98AG31]
MDMLRYCGRGSRVLFRAASNALGSNKHHTRHILIMQQPTINFKPKYTQPITLDALLELDPGFITAEISRLENSINHLTRSNSDLLMAEKEEDDAAERKVFVLAREENEDVIESQRERITMMKLALNQMLGIDSDNPHYAKDKARGEGGDDRTIPRADPVRREPTSSDEDVGVFV